MDRIEDALEIEKISKGRKYYLLIRSSARGMGSDSDYCLVTEENLHKIMSEDEIRRSLIECNTYDQVPDLILLPESVPVKVETFHVENTIFRVHNQFDCQRDIIVGDALFTRYFVDLSNFDGDLGYRFEEKTVYEFTLFDFKLVIENHFFLFYKAEDLLKAYRDKLERLKALENPNADMVAEAEDMIRRVENLPVMKDEYYDHFFHQKYPYVLDFMEEFVAKELARDCVDHTMCVYDRCILPDRFACEIGAGHEDLPRYFRYDELFVRGTDVKHLVADLIGSREMLGGFDNFQADMALLTVFGYD